MPAQVSALSASQKRVSLSRLNQITSALSERRRQVKGIQQQVAEIHKNLNRIVQEYDAALNRLEKTKAEIQENQMRLEAARRELERYQQILEHRTVLIYRHGKIDLLAVLLNAKTFREFLVRLDMLQQIAKRDMEMLNQVKKLEAEIMARGEELERKKVGEKMETEYLRGKQTQIQAELLKEKALLAAVQGEITKLANEQRQERERLERERKARQRRLALLQVRQAGSGRQSSPGIVVDGFVFPVGGPHAYSDTWGDYRSGGRRHKGTDIYALKGTPAVAAVNGVIHSLENQALGGLVLRLRSDNGDIYSYVHLNGYASGISVGTRVRAGQTIAYVGNTGNASDGPDHLHFEIHPGGGGAINPYPILRAAE